MINMKKSLFKLMKTEDHDVAMPFFREAWERKTEMIKSHGTWRSMLINNGVTPAWWLIRNITKSSQKLDNILYPEWRHQKVKAPVFITANARSGTTFFHGLLSLDDEQFVSSKLYESIFPSISIQNSIASIAESHGLIQSLSSSVVNAINKKIFNGWKDIHPIGLNQIEEDECVFILPMHSATLSLLIPEVEQTEDLFWLDHMSDEIKKPLLEYYESVIQKHLFMNGPTKRYLNKNVFMTTRMMSMYQHFEDAQFIYLMRHPYQSIGSFLDMFYRAWVVHHPKMRKDAPQVKALAKIAIKQYLYALSCKEKIPSSQFYLLKYDDLVKSPRATVEKVYQQFGWTMTSKFTQKLDAELSKQRSFKSEHRYDLEDFGITREEIYKELHQVFDLLGFEP